VWPRQVQQVAGLVKASSLLPLNTLSNAIRQEFLFQAGFGLEEESEHEAFMAEAHSKGPWRMWNGHVALMASFLLWSLQVAAGHVQCANPLLVQSWIEGTAGDGDPAVLANHRKALEVLFSGVLKFSWCQYGP
jgi:hypothetical protein